jgi:hypothetical protein
LINPIIFSACPLKCCPLVGTRTHSTPFLPAHCITSLKSTERFVWRPLQAALPCPTGIVTALPLGTKIDGVPLGSYQSNTYPRIQRVPRMSWCKQTSLPIPCLLASCSRPLVLDGPEQIKSYGLEDGPEFHPVIW